MREFIAKHPGYKQDSVVSELVARDLVEEITAVAHGDKPCPELLGKHVVCNLGEALSVGRADARLRSFPGVPGKALRGSSFHNDVGTTRQSTFQCAIVRALVEKYAKNHVLSPDLKASILVEGHGFDQTRPLFKRAKTG
jgi:hypothetical protein